MQEVYDFSVPRYENYIGQGLVHHNSLSASRETAYHLTGLYPSWWNGKRFTKPTMGWAGSPTGQSTRDTVQMMLLGRPEAIGTGAIPKHLIIETKRAAGNVPDLMESIIVQHVSGGVSTLILKSYDQGRLRWQGATLEFVWFDEEPPFEIWSEGCARTNASKERSGTTGITYMTFTPLLGMSEVVIRFLKQKPIGSHVTEMTIYDALHYTDEDWKRIIEKYPVHERDARAMGIPIMGSGRVFDTDEQVFSELPPFIPSHWPRLAAMDIGFDHPTAVIWFAWDRDTDTVHLYDCYRVREALPPIHAAAIRAKGAWIPVAWPHDALQRASGVQVAQQYRACNVKMLPQKATHPPEKGKLEGTGGYGFEAGVMEMATRLKTSRLKVAKHLADWFEEYRLYHREKGLIVKENDDLMSATRIGLMMLRHATTFAPAQQQPIVQVFTPSDAGMGCLG